MTNDYKRQMMVLPVVKATALFVLVLGTLNILPFIIENGLSGIEVDGRSSDTVDIPRFPAPLQLFVTIVVTLPLIGKAVGSITSYRKWQSGASPPCPDCSGPMVQRKAGRGNFRGQKFWGCVTYPACKGKEHIGW